ncbi:unnamed protein product [Sphagnum balticum]
MPHRDLEIYRRTAVLVMNLLNQMKCELSSLYMGGRDNARECNQVLTLELVDGRAEGHTKVLGLTGFAHSKKTGKNLAMIESAGSHEKS